MTTDVFLSYSSKDVAVTDKICAALESRGIRCWVAPRDVLPGTSYAEAIIEGINGARVMVVVFSSNSDASEQVRREVERAGSRRGMSILPVRVEDVRPSGHMEFFLSSQHWLDAFQPPLKPHLDRLAQTVASILAQKRGEKTTAPVTPPPVVDLPSSPGKETSSSPLIIAAISALCVLLFVVGYLAFQNLNYSRPDPSVPPNPLAALVEQVEANNWIDARREANRLSADPKISKSSAYVQLLKKVEAAETDQANQSLFANLNLIKKSADGISASQTAEENVGQLKLLLDKVHALSRTQDSRAKPSLVSEVTNLEKKLDTNLAQWNRRLAFEKEIEKLSPSGGIEQLAHAIVDVRDRFPLESKGDAIDVVVDEANLWPGISHWNKFFSRAVFLDPAKLTPEAAGTLLIDGADLKARFPIAAYVNELDARSNHLTRVQQRMADLNGLKDLSQVLVESWTVKSRFMQGMTIVKLTNNDCYYCSIIPVNNPKNPGTTEINYVVDFFGTTQKKPLRRNEIAAISSAPHCDLVLKLIDRLGNAPQIRTTEWVPAFSEALKMIQQSEDIDPIIVATLYGQVLRSGSEGSMAIGKAFAPLQQAIGQARIEPLVKWFLPTDAQAQAQRRAAKIAIGNLPNLDGPAREAIQIEQRLNVAPQCRFEYAGWLKTTGNGWQISDAQTNSPSGSLFVVTKNSGASEAEMSEVGSVKAGQVTWAPDAQRLLLPWRPLFIKR